MVLDLQTQTWTKFGELSSFIKSNLATTRPVTSSPFGLLVIIGDKFMLLDYLHNKVVTIDSKKDNFQTLYRQLYRGNIYFKDSTLFYGSNESGQTHLNFYFVPIVY